MQYAFCIDKELKTLAQAFKPINIARISTGIVRRETSFIYTVQSVLNYAQAFEKVYAVSLVYYCVLSIADYIVLSNFLAASSKATFACYVHFSKLKIKNEDVPTLLLRPAIDAPLVNTLNITHVEDLSLYMSTVEDILVLI